ncbi:MAG: hypothetical protein P4L50_18190 [Anaerolineaceae bacterium]|nr:hypothetical protein [Anaerolineaceae bacterium]
MTDVQLMQYFKFDETDLAANRQGHITDKQAARLYTEDKFYRVWRRRLAGLLFVLAVAGLVFAWTGYPADSAKMAVGGAWCLIALVWGFLLLRRAAARPAYIIARAQGPAKVVELRIPSEHASSQTYHELQIGGKRFMGTTILAGILQADAYDVYYLDRTKEHPYDTSYLHPSEDILSAEPLQAGAPANLAPDAELVACIQQGDLMGAIKRHRILYNSNYEEAKKAVDLLKASLGS